MPTSDAARPLRVVSVLTTHAAGGAEFAAVDMLAALAGRGVRVRLLTNRVDLAAGTCVPASPIALGPKLRSRTVTRVAMTAPLTLARLLVALRREAPIDVLLVHYKKEQLLSALVPRSVARARVWAEWGPLPLQVRSGWARFVYAQASRSADVVIAESAATSRTLAAAGVDPAKIVVVPNVLDAELRFDPGARADLRRQWGLEESFVLGCISRLDSTKRIDVAIDALGDLDQRVALVIAGEGEDEPVLRRRAARHGRRVLFVGGARGRVAQILSACDVQVYAPGPSEGAARAVTFGQLVGRPVIATGPEGARDLIGAGTGTIVSPAHDVAALVRCIESYRTDPPRVVEEGLAGRAAAVRRIADANAVEVLEQALRHAAGAAPRRPLRWPRPEATRRRSGQ